MEKPTLKRRKSRSQSVKDWIGSPSYYLYVNYVLGAWGDWMWQFAVGLFLVKLSGGPLRLAAIYGFCGGGCVLLFGGLIGDWIDRNRRLKVMITTLFLQNMSVMLSAMAVCFTLRYGEWIDNTLDGGMRYICEGVIVTMAICAQMSSVGYKIAIEKDWIVVIAAGKKAFLANLNAVTRAIDLSCKILAPCTVGIVMTCLSHELAALLIAVWNLVSVFIEFALLRKVYSLVPALAIKSIGDEESVFDEDSEAAEPVCLNPSGDSPDEPETSSDPDVERQESTQPLRSKSQTEPKKKKEEKSCVRTMFEPFITLVNGWRTYARQSVVFAGLSLAFLYMTVLGFDSITVGYIYANGVKEYLVAVAMGLAGFTGILGTIFFTILRRKGGLERTGLIAFSAEIFCLCFCVASLYTPGNTFEPMYKPTDPYIQPMTIECHNRSTDVLNETRLNHVVKREVPNFDMHEISATNGAFDDYEVTYLTVSTMNHGNLPSFYHSHGAGNSELYHSYMAHSVTSAQYRAPVMAHLRTRRQAAGNDSAGYDTSDHVMETELEEDVECHTERDWASYISITLFLIGIITSRIGLWMADLVVTQLLQENVLEKERGVVNGVQNSLNMLMDMLKFTLVIAVPSIPHFGYLILASFVFICTAGCLFAYHTWRVRNSLAPCKGCTDVSVDEENAPPKTQKKNGSNGKEKLRDDKIGEIAAV